MTKTHIIIHHSATKDGPSNSWEAIRKYHVETNGWSDIGYNYGVEDINGKYEIMVGRPEDVPGAHTKELNMNKLSLGVCIVGNFDILRPPILQALAAFKLVKSLMAKHNIPSENVWGHREAQEKAGLPLEHRKTCPGRAFDMDAFRAAL